MFEYLVNNLVKFIRRVLLNYYIQVVAFLTSFCVNLYLVCCFLFNSDFRELKNYPIFLVNLIDLIVTGPGFFSLLFSQQFIRISDYGNISRQGHLVTWANTIRDTVRPFAHGLFVRNFSWFWYICIPDLLTQRLNMYSNCLCALTLAYERYVLTCKPYDKDIILTDKRRYRTYIALTAVIVTMLAVDGFIRYITYDFECALGFSSGESFNSKMTFSRLLSEAVVCTIFGLLPAVLCGFYYYQSVTVLFSRKKKIGRNLNLIFCFAMVCLIWWISFLIRCTFIIYMSILASRELPRDLYRYPVIRNMYMIFLYYNFSAFSSVFNPFLMLLAQTDYRKPFLDKIKQIRNRLPKLVKSDRVQGENTA